MTTSSLTQKKVGRYIIKPTQELKEGRVIIPGIYHDGGQLVVLTSGYGVTSKQPEIGSGVTKFNMTFGKNEPPIVIEILPDDPMFNEKQRFIKALERHDACVGRLEDGKPTNPNFNPSNPRHFYIVAEADMVNERYTDIKNKVRLATQILAMDLKELRDLAFLEGFNPEGLNEADLVVKFADFGYYSEFDIHKNRRVGVLMENAELSLRNLKAPERSFEINANKAIKLGIVDKKDAYFRLNGTHIGTSVTDVVLFFKNNEELYQNYILPAIAKEDGLALSNVEVAEQAAALANSNRHGTTSQEAIEILRLNEAQKLCRVRGIRYTKDDTSATLEAKISDYNKLTPEEQIKFTQEAMGYSLAKTEKAEKASRETEENLRQKLREELKAAGVKITPPNASLEQLKKLKEENIKETV